MRYILLIIVLCLLVLFYLLSRRKRDYIHFFNQHYDIFKNISQELIEGDVEGKIELDRAGGLQISSDELKHCIESDKKLETDIKTLLRTNEIKAIDVKSKYVEYYLKNPPKDYRGWYVYNPYSTFWGGAQGFTETIAENWILEIVPNT